MSELVAQNDNACWTRPTGSRWYLRGYSLICQFLEKRAGDMGGHGWTTIAEGGQLRSDERFHVRAENQTMPKSYSPVALLSYGMTIRGGGCAPQYSATPTSLALSQYCAR